MAQLHTYISLLRGINVSGQKTIKMTELKALFESLSLKNVATYIQSGNVVFQSGVSNRESLAATIEKAIEKSFGFSVAIVLRQPAEFRKVINRCPYLAEPAPDDSRLYVTFLKSAPAPSLVKALPSGPGKSAETFKVFGSEIYLLCPNGYGKAQYSNGFFEKQLKVAATTRNWKTVNTLLAMSAAL